jgi:Tfp pilus assembly protein PilW
MKFSPNISSRRRRRLLYAFTLAEMMIASTIYLIIFVGVMVAIQVFALRVYTLAATKLTSTQSSRKALNQIRDDIRQAKLIQVGNCTNGNPATFTAVAATNGAVGNALEVYGTTNQGAPYSIYYLQVNSAGASNNLMAYLVDTNSVATTNTLATYITNSIIFTAEDCFGNTVSNFMQNNQIFTVTLQFYMWEYPIGYVSAGGGLNAYDYYQLRTKVCRRALN